MEAAVSSGPQLVVAICNGFAEEGSCTADLAFFRLGIEACLKLDCRGGGEIVDDGAPERSNTGREGGGIST